MFKIGILYFILWIVAALGWGINAVKAITGIIALAQLSDIGGELALRAIGIVVAPLGVVMGLFFW